MVVRSRAQLINAVAFEVPCWELTLFAPVTVTRRVEPLSAAVTE